MNTINVTINNKETQLERGTTPSQLLKLRKMRRAAVWINGKQLLLVDYETHEIKEGDTIRLLRIMAGG